jgi:hypothetical protein
VAPVPRSALWRIGAAKGTNRATWPDRARDRLSSANVDKRLDPRKDYCRCAVCG